MKNVKEMINGYEDDYAIMKRDKEQGRIDGFPSRVRVGRSSAGEGHESIWAGA